MNASANAQHQQIQPTDTDGNPAANASVYNLANKAYFLSDSAGKTWIKTGADITIIANTKWRSLPAIQRPELYCRMGSRLSRLTYSRDPMTREYNQFHVDVVYQVAEM
jgi:hypothetical protein